MVYTIDSLNGTWSCENILECELDMLPGKRQYKKVIAWNGDFGMDRYVSWSLSSEELTLKTIWEKGHNQMK